MLFAASDIPLANDKVARGDSQDWNKAENNVSDQEELGLLLEKLLVEPELVFGLERKVLPVDHIVIEVEEEVVDLVDEDKCNHCDKVGWVDGIVAISHPEGGQEESKRNGMHTDSENLVKHA